MTEKRPPLPDETLTTADRLQTGDHIRSVWWSEEPPTEYIVDSVPTRHSARTDRIQIMIRRSTPGSPAHPIWLEPDGPIYRVDISLEDLFAAATKETP